MIRFKSSIINVQTLQFTHPPGEAWFCQLNLFRLCNYRMRGTMKKVVRQLCIILGAVLFIGFSIRAVLGLTWMVSHFREVQEFAPVSSGIYPLLMQVAGSLSQVLYVLQLGAAFGAGWQLLKVLGVSHRLWRTWGALVLLSLPMAIQCHMALLPYSFVSSLVLLELSFCIQNLAEDSFPSYTKLVQAGCCMLGLTLLLPEYGWLGAIPMVLTMLFQLRIIWKQVKRLLYSCLLVAVFCGMAGGIISLVSKEEDSSRSFWLSMASRTAWPTIWIDSQSWSQELHDLVGDAACWEIAIRPGDMEGILQPLLENKVGAAQAEMYYREMVAVSWERHSGQILKQMIWDVLIYGVPEAVLQLQFQGRSYDSASGRNYEIMMMRHPILTKFYVSYSCWWFWVSLGLAALLLIARFADGDKARSRKYLAVGIMAMLWMAAIVFYYVMQGAGIADYKYTLAVSQLWCVLAVVICYGGLRSEKE